MNNQPTEETYVDINGAIEAMENDNYDLMSKIAHNWEEQCDRSYKATQYYLIKKLQQDKDFTSHEKLELLQDIERFIQNIFNKIPKFSSKIRFTVPGMKWLYRQWIERQKQASIYMIVQS